MDSLLETLQTTFYGPDWCDFKAVDFAEHTVNIHAYVAEELSWFAGHFPDQSVLPGVVQTHWATELAQHFFTAKRINKVTNLKFKTMILPATSIIMKLRFNPDKNAISFVFENDNDTFSTGSLTFSAGL